MPNCFQLTKKGETEAATLASVDEAICEHLGVEVHPVKYVERWYDYIGFLLSLGHTFSQIHDSIIEDFGSDSVMLKINEFLRENYEPTAWAER